MASAVQQVEQSQFADAEWYAGYTELKGFLDRYCGPSLATLTLVVGCGNSKLSKSLVSHGKGEGLLNEVVNIDISMAVIQRMRQAHRRDGWRRATPGRQ